MAVKWIKITTSMFDDEKIKLIETLPDKDTILIIWIKLLTLAGKTNASGYLFLNENIPYTDEMLAAIFSRPVNTVRMALETFQRFGMIEIDEKQFILITNWEKHQNVDGMEKIREQDRLRKQKQRERLKGQQQLLGESRDSHGTVTECHATEEDIEEDIEEELEQEIDKEKKKKKSKRHAPAKVKCAEFVSLSEEEQKTLVNEFGADDAARLIELLNNYKGATGKTYKSDYMAIRSWVINRLQEEKSKLTGRGRKAVVQDELPKGVQKQKEIQNQGGFEQKSITFEEWKEERRACGDYTKYTYMDFFNAIGGAT